MPVQQAAPRPAWLHSDCLHAQHENVGRGLARWSGRGRREAPTDRVARIWEEHDSVLSIAARQEGRTLHLLQQQLWAQHVHVERTRNRAVQHGRKWMGASRLERAEPHGGSPEKRTTSWLDAGLYAGGLRGTGRDGTYMEAQHRVADGQPKVNGGHATGACWAPRAVHRDRRLHCACYFNRVPTWTPSRPPTRHSHSSFGVTVLNCVQELKNRPFWIALSGLKRAACRVLAALSALQQRPHVPLFENYVFSIYVWLILKYSC